MEIALDFKSIEHAARKRSRAVGAVVIGYEERAIDLVDRENQAVLLYFDDLPIRHVLCVAQVNPLTQDCSPVLIEFFHGPPQNPSLLKVGP